MQYGESWADRKRLLKESFIEKIIPRFKNAESGHKGYFINYCKVD